MASSNLEEESLEAITTYKYFQTTFCDYLGACFDGASYGEAFGVCRPDFDGPPTSTMRTLISATADTITTQIVKYSTSAVCSGPFTTTVYEDSTSCSYNALTFHKVTNVITSDVLYSTVIK
jgi:hypothetical protein